MSCTNWDLIFPSKIWALQSCWAATLHFKEVLQCLLTGLTARCCQIWVNKPISTSPGTASTSIITQEKAEVEPGARSNKARARSSWHTPMDVYAHTHGGANPNLLPLQWQAWLCRASKGRTPPALQRNFTPRRLRTFSIGICLWEKPYFFTFQKGRVRHHLLLTFPRHLCQKLEQRYWLQWASHGLTFIVSKTMGRFWTEFLILHIFRLSHKSVFCGSLQSTGGNKVCFSRDGSADCTAKGKATVDVKKPPCYPVTELSSQKSQKSPAQTNRHICQQLLLIFLELLYRSFHCQEKEEIFMMVTEKPWNSKSDPQWCKLELLQWVQGTLPIYTGWTGSLVIPALLCSSHEQLEVAHWGITRIPATVSSWLIPEEKKHKGTNAEVEIRHLLLPWT